MTTKIEFGEKIIDVISIPEKQDAILSYNGNSLLYSQLVDFMASKDSIRRVGEDLEMSKTDTIFKLGCIEDSLTKFKFLQKQLKELLLNERKEIEKEHRI